MGKKLSPFVFFIILAICNNVFAVTADSFRYPVGNENGNGWLKNRTGLQWLEGYDYEGTCGLVFHPGVDFNKDDTSCDDDEGEPVYAVANGEVIESYYETGSDWMQLFYPPGQMISLQPRIRVEREKLIFDR